ncbi:MULTISPECIES: type II toxin-antitoxin system RelE/ParE family toxin [Sinorhizobium/Ensifer group]|uniref:type II toxin-antitoxin system RelE/ParE family toxin n=1 Tax=Sinorhizobium/Ensifer group TaxID=227292 RepID=UPI0009840E6E|nr:MULTISPECIES: type II toxin-antitoxin system RelE/ParE family toxin [Sinorhizobium/Ensifer group]OOG75021.1 plasmid stabilization protein [Sinorhizobium sp. A49]
MPQIVFASAAVRDLERLREFLLPKSPSAAKRAGEAILKGVQALGAHPSVGRLIDDLPDQHREWLIDFGGSGWVMPYRIDEDTLPILAVRHQKEAGF